jgi:hypothetical protein
MPERRHEFTLQPDRVGANREPGWQSFAASTMMPPWQKMQT